MQKNTILTLFFTIMLTSCGNGETPINDRIVCTQDAMQCPDGTWVGRTGKNCEFICNDNK